MEHRLSSINTRVDALQRQYDRESGILSALTGRLTEAQQSLDQVMSKLGVGEQVQLLFAKTSEHARAQIKAHVEATVTAALQAVFGTDIRFEVSLREVGNQTAADWRVVDDMGDTEIAGDPEDSRGGGISDVVSLALRLSMLELVRPRLEGPILLDEVGKHVSAQHREALGEFLRYYAQQTNRQIILITHAEELAGVADVAYQVTRTDGVSEVARL